VLKYGQFDNAANIVLYFDMSLFRKKKQCPRCDSYEIKEVKPTFWQKVMSAGVAPWGKPPKTLNVCRSCGFSWEDR
jgi:transposase-like protein